MSTTKPTKFLFLYRTPAGGPAWKPSPEEMQAMFKQWTDWKSKFDAEIIDLGDGLKQEANTSAVYRNGAVTDGPFIEAKEVMGGYTIVATKSLARAIEIAKDCPMNRTPGASIEIRELANF